MLKSTITNIWMLDHSRTNWSELSVKNYTQLTNVVPTRQELNQNPIDCVFRVTSHSTHQTVIVVYISG